MNRVQSRIEAIVARGLRKNTQQNFGFAKTILKENMDSLQGRMFELEVKDEKTQRMKEQALDEKKREQKSIARTLNLIQSHTDFLTSTRVYQAHNPSKKLSSIFDIVKKHRKSIVKTSISLNLKPT